MGRRIAFLIGNQTFRDDSLLAPLKGPLNDIAALSAVLGDTKRGGFELRQFSDATSSEIKPAIEEQLMAAERGDLVLIHYAGHGKLDRIGNLCLATADTRANSLLSTSIPARHLRDLASNSDCDAVILLLDCCYSGAAASGDTRGDVESQLRSLQDASGFYILTASSEIQTAGEAEEMRDGKVMGRFTSAIVDGLETGSADIDRDGRITLYDLVHHVKASVKHQTPQFLAARASGDPLIALNPSTTPLLDQDAIVDLQSAHWGRRLGAVAFLAGIVRGSDLLAANAARELLSNHLRGERDVEVRRRAEEALFDSRASTSQLMSSPSESPQTLEPEARNSLSPNTPEPSADRPAYAFAPDAKQFQAPAPNSGGLERFLNWRVAALALFLLFVTLGAVTILPMLFVQKTQVAERPASATPQVVDSGKSGSDTAQRIDPNTTTAPSATNSSKQVDASLILPSPATNEVTPAKPETNSRFVLNACGSITDRWNKRDWLVGPDKAVSWPEAESWARSNKACDGGWSLPDGKQAASLYDKTKKTGKGYCKPDSCYPARIDPIFGGIGDGSWIWIKGQAPPGKSLSYNFWTGEVAVPVSSDGKEFPMHMFAVRETREQN